jgi:hypothetical protein
VALAEEESQALDAPFEHRGQAIKKPLEIGDDEINE